MTFLQIPDNIDGGLGRSGQSVEPAPPRKKQKQADEVGGARKYSLAPCPRHIASLSAIPASSCVGVEIDAPF